MWGFDLAARPSHTITGLVDWTTVLLDYWTTGLGFFSLFWMFSLLECRICRYNQF